ncbi:MAG: citrate transporter [Lachnospiraceae bacterium]|nr:citrate transporter [Lachnospiraceae bacterium]
MKVLKKIKNILTIDPVLTIAGILALISCIFVHPDRTYASYIDFRVLGILCMLMLIVAGLMEAGLFDILMHALLARVHSAKALSLSLILVSFFMSMFLTNDVTLITIVPFTIMTISHTGIAIPNHYGSHTLLRYRLMLTLILETLAANLGSMLLPIGNPQNLYLYNYFSMNLGHFLITMLPFTLLSFLLLIGAVHLFIPNDGTVKKANEIVAAEKKAEKKATKKESGKESGKESEKESESKNKTRLLLLYAILFVIAVLTVARIVDYKLAFLAVAVITLCVKPRLFKEVNYRLLITFVFFYVLIGNLGRIPAFHDWLVSITKTNPLLISVAASQVISNVPAAVLFSSFTPSADNLLIGVNLGGLGTLITSMASLITYQQYSAEMRSLNRKHAIRDYIIYFTNYSLVFLVALLVLARIIK